MATLAILIYGLVSLVGGLIGYFQAGSKASLISGSISGVLMLICSYLMSQGFKWAYLIAGALTLLLIFVFSIRLQKTGKFMPAGLMIAFGVVALILIISQY